MCNECAKKKVYTPISKNFSIKCAGIVWKVIFTPNIGEEECGPCYGYCSYSDMTVHIATNNTILQQKLTLLHEFHHIATRHILGENGMVFIEHACDSSAEFWAEVMPQLLKKIPNLFVNEKEIEKVKKSKKVGV